MYGIVICGGGGKTTLASKYGETFLDIDDFVWNDANKKFHPHLINAINKQNNSMIGNIYYKILTDNKKILQNSRRIILLHHPINAKWLNITFKGILRPSNLLLKNNIKNRTLNEQLLAITNWLQLKNYDYIEYNDFNELILLLDNIIKHNKNLM